MRLKVRHTTHYTYDAAPHYLVQRLLLEPSNYAAQKTISWRIGSPGMDKALRYRDGYGNWVHLVTAAPEDNTLEIVAEGEVETMPAAGVVQGLGAVAPEAVFLRTTPATALSAPMARAINALPRPATILEGAHSLMQFIHGNVAYELGTSHAHTTAAEAFADRRGVCQDQAHILISMARARAIPARYVTGYLVTGVGATSSAAHAWAELFIPDLGWVGFDPANGQCPTDHYVRIAAGHDAAAVTPVRGSRRGGQGAERLAVEVSVEISQQ